MFYRLILVLLAVALASAPTFAFQGGGTPGGDGGLFGGIPEIGMSSGRTALTLLLFGVLLLTRSPQEKPA